MHRLEPGVRRGSAISIIVDGETVSAYLGESVATALLASGRRILRITPKKQVPRGLFCGMGVCFECLVTIDDQPNQQACMTVVRAGMRVERQVGAGQIVRVPRAGDES